MILLNLPPDYRLVVGELSLFFRGDYYVQC